MKNTFKTAFVAARDGIIIFPAVSMGVWRGPPELYWTAFLDAVIENGDNFEKVFVSPGHQASSPPSPFAGKKGEEFQLILNEYVTRYQGDERVLRNLQKVVNLFNQGTDVLQLARNLKAFRPDVRVSVFNASDPDVTTGYHVGEFTNNWPHIPPTTEENITAMGTNGLCFEQITNIHEEGGARIIQV